jgi:hypothetical protein
MSHFSYSTSSKRYYDNRTGRFVGRVEVRSELDNIIDSSAGRMKSWTNSLRQSDMSISKWQTLMASEIKALHMSFAAAANGGWQAMDTEDWNRVSDYIDFHLQYLQNFAEEIYTGEQPSNGTMATRATLYAEAARITYEDERRLLEIRSGATEEKNLLGGSDHCNGCVEATLAGWVPINGLVPIGSRECTSRCRCTIIYRQGPEDTLGSAID